MGSNQNSAWVWITGLILALVLIVISTRDTAPGNPTLSQYFAPRPTDPNAPTPEPLQLPQVHLPNLPPEAQQMFTGLRDRLAGGEPIPALTPVANSPRVQVKVGEIRRTSERVQVRGTIANIANGPVKIPPGAFSFYDSAGITYETGTIGGITLQPGESTTFDLGVPLPEGRGLSLALTLPPDPPLVQILTVEVTR